MITRRDFLHGAGAVGLARLVSQHSSALAADTPPQDIVDTHQHLWDLKKFKLPWLEKSPKLLKRNYTTEHYLAATKGLSVRAVYMEVNVAPEQKAAEARHVIRLSESDEHPTCAAVISGIPSTPEFAAHIKKFAKNPYVKGARRVLHDPEVPRGHCLQPQFRKNMQLLGELGLSFDLCMRPRELADAAKLAAACPDTRFIVDHCGNADPKAFLSNPAEEPWHDADDWKRDMEALAQQKNTICKISGIVVRAPKDSWGPKTLAPIVNHCLDTFGPDRVVFGSDWPVCRLVAELRDWVDALSAIIAERPAAEQDKLWHKNATRLYRLAGKS